MTNGEESPVFAYDEVPYVGAVEAEAHPRCLEAIAGLRGMQPAALDAARVLELGCAGGRMLLQLAEEFPDSHFVGVDLSGGRIDEAAAIAADLGLQNAEFRRGSMAEVDASWGAFDYILCLGVLSWVPPGVQQRIFRVLETNLSRQGVAAVTYKTYPGWHHLNVVRDALRFHTDAASQPLERITAAKETLQFLAREAPENSVQGRIYREDAKYLRDAQDDYFFHDYLADNSHPLYFHEFHRRAVECKLQYLGETNFARNNLPPEASAAGAVMAEMPLVKRCQLLDFLNNTAYRKSILCRAEVELQEAIDPQRLKTLHLALREIPTPASFDIASPATLQFRYESGSLSIAAPFGKAALRHLIDVYPRAISVSELCEGANRLLPQAVQRMRMDGEAGENLLAAAMLSSLQAGLILVSVRPPDFVQTISDKPTASPLARTLAQRHAIIANRCHQNVKLSHDALLLLSHLDGTTGPDHLTQQLASRPADSERPRGTPQQRLDRALCELRDRAFLTR